MASQAAPALSALAADLRAAAPTGLSRNRLKGKNVGLVCAEPGRAQALRVCRAGSDLGAHVALVYPRFDDAGDVGDTARMLGRFYDAIVCLDVAVDIVERVRAVAGIPVLDQRAAFLQDDAARVGADVVRPADDEEGFLWQAALVMCLG